MVGPNFLQIQQTTINGSMIGYVTPFFFTFLEFGHFQWVAGVQGRGVKVGPKKQTLGISFA